MVLWRKVLLFQVKKLQSRDFDYLNYFHDYMLKDLLEKLEKAKQTLGFELLKTLLHASLILSQFASFILDVCPYGSLIVHSNWKDL